MGKIRNTLRNILQESNLKKYFTFIYLWLKKKISLKFLQKKKKEEKNVVCVM